MPPACQRKAEQVPILLRVLLEDVNDLNLMQDFEVALLPGWKSKFTDSCVIGGSIIISLN